MGFINACVDKARENDMLAYLYDEDRWPSGSAGGIVTQNDEYRQRLLRFTTVPYKKERKNDIFFVENTTVRTEEGILLTVFDIELDDKGYLKEYRQIQPEDEVKGTKWYVYMDYSPKTSWFNNQSYVDTMNKEAMDRFIEVTYEAYNRNCSKDFGGVIPSIFTDEPQVAHKERLNSSFDTCDVTLPWTPTFPDTYKAKSSEDVNRLLRQENLIINDENEEEKIFELKANESKRIEVTFCGEYGGKYQKNDRNLPDIITFEIIS